MDEARKKQVQVLEMERERQVKALEEERQEKIRALEKELKDIEVARLEQFEKERRGLEETVKRLASDLDTARKKSEEQDEAIEVLLEEIKVLQQLHDETAVCACVCVTSCLDAKLKIPLRLDGEAHTHAQSAPASAAVDLKFMGMCSSVLVTQEVVAEGQAQVQSGFDIQRGLEEDLYAAQSMQVSLLMDTEHQHAKHLEVWACAGGSATSERRGRPYSLIILNTSMRSWVNALVLCGCL